MLNAVEPGTVVTIHRRVAKDECFVVLRGKVGVTTHDDDGSIIEDVVLSQERTAKMKELIREHNDFLKQLGLPELEV